MQDPGELMHFLGLYGVPVSQDMGEFKVPSGRQDRHMPFGSVVNAARQDLGDGVGTPVSSSHAEAYDKVSHGAETRRSRHGSDVRLVSKQAVNDKHRPKVDKTQEEQLEAACTDRTDSATYSASDYDKIEFGPACTAAAKWLYLPPVSRQALVHGYPILCLKVRDAQPRRERMPVQVHRNECLL